MNLKHLLNLTSASCLCLTEVDTSGSHRVTRG